MNVLVTGGAGYIGSHTVVELQKSGHHVIIVDNLSNAKANVIDHIQQITGTRPVFYQIDCADKKAMRIVFDQNLKLPTPTSGTATDFCKRQRQKSIRRSSELG